MALRHDVDQRPHGLIRDLQHLGVGFHAELLLARINQSARGIRTAGDRLRVLRHIRHTAGDTLLRVLQRPCADSRYAVHG